MIVGSIPAAEEFEPAHSVTEKAPSRIVSLVSLKIFRRLGFFYTYTKRSRQIAEDILRACGFANIWHIRNDSLVSYGRTEPYADPAPFIRWVMSRIDSRLTART
jgi:hypothetical protein